MAVFRIRLFAGLAEHVGQSHVEIETSQTETVTASSIKQLLLEKYPNLKKQIEHAMVAVNYEYARADVPIQSTDELALIPPVSGG